MARTRAYLIKPNSTQHLILRIHAEKGDWVKDAAVRNDPRISQAPQTHFENTHAYKMSEYDLTIVGKRGKWDQKAKKRVGESHWRESKITALGLKALEALDAGKVWNGDLKKVDLEATTRYREQQYDKERVREANIEEDHQPLPGKERRFWLWDDAFTALDLLVNHPTPVSGSEVLNYRLHGPMKILLRYTMIEVTKEGRRTNYTITETGRRAHAVMQTGVPFNTFFNGPDYRPSNFREYMDVCRFMNTRWAFRNHVVDDVNDRRSADGKSDLVMYGRLSRFISSYRGGAIPRDNANQIIELLRGWKRGPVAEVTERQLTELLDEAEHGDPSHYNHEKAWKALKRIFQDRDVEIQFPQLADRYMLTKLARPDVKDE